MTGRRPNIFWKACWMVISPLLLLVVFVAYVIVQAQTRPTYPAWNPDYVSTKAKNWRMNLLMIQDFIRCSLFGPRFIFRTALILHGVDLIRRSKRSLEILSSCWHDGIAQLLQICFSVPSHPKGTLLDWDLLIVETIWVQWTHCYDQ